MEEQCCIPAALLLQRPTESCCTDEGELPSEQAGLQVWRCFEKRSGFHTDCFLVQMGMKQWGNGCQLVQAPNWVAAAAEGECGMTAVHSMILEWHKVDAAAAAGMAVGYTAHLMVGGLKKEWRHMADREEQS